MIFVDTSAWFALTVPTDPDCQRARDWVSGNQQPLITTDYVLDELLTLLKKRGEYVRALRVGQELLTGVRARLEWVTPTNVRAAWEVFSRFRDKDWSFTDCISRVVMERLSISTAFAFDHHFRQFGTVTVVP